jgi:hypothetical protein
MTSPQRPTKPCPHCDSTRFAVVPEFHFEVICWKKKGGGNNFSPSFTAQICLGCRATTFIALAGHEALPESVEHTVVDIAEGGTPYR